MYILFFSVNIIVAPRRGTTFTLLILFLLWQGDVLSEGVRAVSAILNANTPKTFLRAGHFKCLFSFNPQDNLWSRCFRYLRYWGTPEGWNNCPKVSAPEYFWWQVELKKWSLDLFLKPLRCLRNGYYRHLLVPGRVSVLLLRLHQDWDSCWGPVSY